MKNKYTPLKADDIRQMLIDACEELIDDRRGNTVGDVITRMIGHENKFTDIKALREIYDCTQDEMATALNVTPSAIKSWEQGIREPRGPSKIVLEAMAVVGIKKKLAEQKEKLETAN